MQRLLSGAMSLPHVPASIGRSTPGTQELAVEVGPNAAHQLAVGDPLAELAQPVPLLRAEQLDQGHRIFLREREWPDRAGLERGAGSP